MKQERIYFLDYLRVIACFMVMIVHSSENFYLCPASDAPSGEMVNVVSKITSTDNLFWVSLLDGFCRMSVPLFMITSAYLLCPLKPEQTWTSFFKRRALRIVPPMIVFLVLYSALPLLWGGTTIEQAIDNILYIPLNFPGAAGHLFKKGFGGGGKQRHEIFRAQHVFFQCGEHVVRCGGCGKRCAAFPRPFGQTFIEMRLSRRKVISQNRMIHSIMPLWCSPGVFKEKGTSACTFWMVKEECGKSPPGRGAEHISRQGEEEARSLSAGSGKFFRGLRHTAESPGKISAESP